ATLFAGFYFLLAIATVGLPPLAGFIGKLLILDAGRAASSTVVVWSAILITSLLLTIGFARTGMQIFWNPSPTPDEPPQRAVPGGPVAVIAGMLVVIAVLSVFADAVMDDLTAMAEQLRAPQRYIAAVLRAQVTMNVT